MNPLRTCPLCDGALEEKPVRYVWERGDELAVIDGVLAHVCRRCGHRWFPAKSARQLEAAFAGTATPIHTLQVPVYQVK